MPQKDGEQHQPNPEARWGTKALPIPTPCSRGGDTGGAAESPSRLVPPGAGTVAQICHSAWLPQPLPARWAPALLLAPRPLIRHDSSIRAETPAKSFLV